MKITPNQRKSFYKIITDNNILWEDFNEVEISKKDHQPEYVKLVHLPTGLYFGFYHNALFERLQPHIGAWYVEFTPGEKNTPYFSKATNKDWKTVLNYFKKWVKLLNSELEAHSFLSQLEYFKKTLNTSSYTLAEYGTQFDNFEENYIRQELQELKDKIKELDLLREDSQKIQLKIDYLTDRLEKKYPKIDWLNIFIGTVVSSLTDGSFELIKEHSFIEHLKLIFNTLTNNRFLK